MSDKGKMLIVLIVLAVAIFLFIKVYRKFKMPKVNCLSMVTGGVKCGKSTFAIHLAMKSYNQSKRAWAVRNFFAKLFHLEEIEEPLLYSNVPLKCDYVPLTEDYLLRKKRFAYKSVIYVNEASLVADSQSFRDKDVNERLLLFNKLIGHELHGGHLIYDTQCIQDVHYSIKRSLSEFYYIHHLVKWIPFLLVAYVREDRYSEDTNIVNVNEGDVEETLKRVVIPKRVWKKFDCYSFSALTDDLPVTDEQEIVDGMELEDLKAHSLVSFNKYRTLEDLR